MSKPKHKVLSTRDLRNAINAYVQEMEFWNVDSEVYLNPDKALTEMAERFCFTESFWREVRAWKMRETVHLVHFDETVRRIAQRGISSPIKSDEIRRFEQKVTEVFGPSDELVTTSWGRDESE